jgi:hypothetical protein
VKSSFDWDFSDEDVKASPRTRYPHHAEGLVNPKVLPT